MTAKSRPEEPAPATKHHQPSSILRPIPHWPLANAEQVEGLRVADYLASCGVPIFLAKPIMVDGKLDTTQGVKGYRFPTEWERIEADPRRLDNWKPGDAVCAVIGTHR